MKKYRITQIDGKYPNCALMKISAYLKMEGHQVFFERSITKKLFEPEYDGVFGSAIFTTSIDKVEIFFSNFPNAVIGGSVWDTVEQDLKQRIKAKELREKYGDQCLRLTTTIEKYLGVDAFEFYDYSIYPIIDYSLGFSASIFSFSSFSSASVLTFAESYFTIIGDFPLVKIGDVSVMIFGFCFEEFTP